jgi:hypothetical protein
MLHFNSISKDSLKKKKKKNSISKDTLHYNQLFIGISIVNSSNISLIHKHLARDMFHFNQQLLGILIVNGIFS